MPGVGLNSATDRKASPERSALKPYWGKPAVRNFREGDGNNGIIEARLAPSPYSTENREISSTPWSQDQGRSAKAINRTADMNVLEKSDCAVLPVNQPNKGGEPSAEVGE